MHRLCMYNIYLLVSLFGVFNLACIDRKKVFCLFKAGELLNLLTVYFWCDGRGRQCVMVGEYSVSMSFCDFFSVAAAHRHDCQSSKFLKLTSQVDYISSVMAEEYGLGSVHCPWIIQVTEGQRINLTLFNFMHGALGKIQTFYLLMLGK